MWNPLRDSFSTDRNILLPHCFRKIGMLIFFLGIPAVLLLTSLFVLLFNISFAFWDEWGLYLMHVPLSFGLYLVLFSEEKNEDEFYLSLRLRSIASGVIAIVSAMALLPFYMNVLWLIIGRDTALPDIGGNMAVCTLLLAYANGAYLYNKSLIEKDD